MTDKLIPADKLEVQVLVDNTTDSLSTNPGNVQSEWGSLSAQNRLPLLSGRATCCAHHGLSLLITAHLEDEKHTILFDSGPDGEVFLRNCNVQAIDFSTIDAVALSHGHWDHAGGLVAALETISKAKSGKIDFLVHPDAFTDRAIQRPDGSVLVFEPIPGQDILEKAGANIVSTRESQVIDKIFYVSGEIPRLTTYETGFPGHVRRSTDGQSWEADPLIMDERFVAVHVKDKGQFVFSACSHAGLVNVLNHARSVFPSTPLYGVMGGFHLAGATEKVIPETVNDLKKFNLKLIAAGHCTGWRAANALAENFQDTLVPLAVGKRYII